MVVACGAALIYRQKPPLMKKSPDDVLQQCRKHAAAGTFLLSDAARERMEREQLSAADLRNVLALASSCVSTGDGMWRVTGKLLDGAVASVVVAFDGGAITVL